LRRSIRRISLPSGNGTASASRPVSRTAARASTADLAEALAASLAGDFVIDGELLIVRDGRVESFSTLQQRLNRKKVTPKLVAEFPAHIIAYDLLARDGNDLRPLGFGERRAQLEAFVREAALPQLTLSPQLDFADWETLIAARADPLAYGAGDNAPAVEGVMLKRLDAPYVPGRPKGLWYKWKRDPFLIDAVLMYAQRGHGKRSSLYSDFTFGVWKGESLVPVGKAYFGFTDAELKQIDKFVRDNTLNRFGPVREVASGPHEGLVLEIAFEGLNRSPRHKSGLAMRFPRISRLRWDKPAREADRIEALEALLGD
jgi:DNA ligase-1